jgi:hypothetical protein
MSKCVWDLEKEELTDFIGALEEEDFRAWLANDLSSLPQEDMVRVVVTLWDILYARRRAIHENIFQGQLSSTSSLTGCSEHGRHSHLFKYDFGDSYTTQSWD